MNRPAPGVGLVERAPTVEEYQYLRRSTGWYMHDDDTVARALPRALFSVCAMSGGETVGCARVVGDGAIYFYIQDLVVLPGHRGRGIGRLLMDAVMDYVGGAARRNSFIGLMAAEGYAGLYEKYGFARRPDDAPGMYRVWEPVGP